MYLYLLQLCTYESKFYSRKGFVGSIVVRSKNPVSDLQPRRIYY